MRLGEDAFLASVSLRSMAFRGRKNNPGHLYLGFAVAYRGVIACEKETRLILPSLLLFR
jgi:hypothetical protein